MEYKYDCETNQWTALRTVGDISVSCTSEYKGDAAQVVDNDMEGKLKAYRKNLRSKGLTLDDGTAEGFNKFIRE